MYLLAEGDDGVYDGAVLLPAVALVDVLAVVVTAGSLHDLPRNLAVGGRGASLACRDNNAVL